MKKLKLNFDLTETLSRDQMKKVIGGYDLHECQALQCDGGFNGCSSLPNCSCTHTVVPGEIELYLCE